LSAAPKSEDDESVLYQSAAAASGSAASAAAAAASQVVGRKVVTLKMRSSEEFSWLKQQVAHNNNTGSSDVEEGAADSRVGTLDIEVYPIMLTLGVNEMQTVANAKGDTGLQTEINRHGLQGLRQYLEAFRGFLERERAGRAMTSIYRSETMVGRESDGTATERGSNGVIVTTCTAILSSLEGLIDAEASMKQRKTVDLLMQSCFAARLLNGARTTSCKSAKDRTSMFHTLELVRLAEERGLLGDAMASRVLNRGRRGGSTTLQQSVLELLRGVNGVRLQNCKDNVGKAAYSFNKVQVATLPTELQPPPWTIGGTSKNS
jgi:hypothetical protein